MNTIIFYMYFMHVVSLTISVTQWVQTNDFIDEETELKESNITVRQRQGQALNLTHCDSKASLCSPALNVERC